MERLWFCSVGQFFTFRQNQIYNRLLKPRSSSARPPILSPDFYPAWQLKGKAEKRAGCIIFFNQRETYFALMFLTVFQRVSVTFLSQDPMKSQVYSILISFAKDSNQPLLYNRIWDNTAKTLSKTLPHHGFCQGLKYLHIKEVLAK